MDAPRPDRKVIAIQVGAMLLPIIVMSIATVLGGFGNQFAHAQSDPEGDSSIDGGTPLITNSSVSGAYSYQDNIQITFPEGWTGLEISEADDSIVTTVVSPQGIPNLDDIYDTEEIMFLVVSQKDAVDMAPGSVPPLLSDNNNVTRFDCALQSSKTILLNSVFSRESFLKCTSPVASNASLSHDMMLHTILTQTSNNWVAVILFGTSDNAQANQKEFESASKTLKVSGAIDVTIPFGLPNFITHKLNWNGSTVQVDVKTSSNITDFTVDEGKKMISFKTEGFSSTEGISEITIGRILEGPYVVTINGETWNDFDISNQESPEEAKIQIRYEHDTVSQVIVTGTRIVPEFPVSGILGTIVALTSAALTGGLATLVRISRFHTSRVQQKDNRQQGVSDPG